MIESLASVTATSEFSKILHQRKKEPTTEKIKVNREKKPDKKL